MLGFTIETMRRIGLLLILLAIASLVAPAFHRQLAVTALLQMVGFGGATAALVLLTAGGLLLWFGSRQRQHAVEDGRNSTKPGAIGPIGAIAGIVVIGFLAILGLQKVNRDTELEAQTPVPPWTGPTLFQPRYGEQTKWPVILTINDGETAAITLRGAANSGGFLFDVALISPHLKSRKELKPDELLRVLQTSLCKEDGFIHRYGLETYPMVFSITLSAESTIIVNIPWGYCSQPAR